MDATSILMTDQTNLMSTNAGTKKYRRNARYRRKLAWTTEEDAKITNLVNLYGHKWAQIASEMPGRKGKNIREHYLNCLDPNTDNSPWTELEDITLFNAQKKLGNVWSQIAKLLPGRTDNKIKNRYYAACRRLQRQGIERGFQSAEEFRNMLHGGVVVNRKRKRPILPKQKRYNSNNNINNYNNGMRKNNNYNNVMQQHQKQQYQIIKNPSLQSSSQTTTTTTRTSTTSRNNNNNNNNNTNDNNSNNMNAVYRFYSFPNKPYDNRIYIFNNDTLDFLTTLPRYHPWSRQ